MRCNEMIINLFFVRNDHSGARTYARELLQQLCYNEIKLHEILIESEEFSEFTVVEKDSVLEIHIPPLVKRSGIIEKYSKRCIDLISSLLIEKNNLIFHLNYHHHADIGLEAQKRFGAKLIYTVHFIPSYFTLLKMGVKLNKATAKKEACVEKKILSKSDSIICVTQFAKNILMIYYGVPESKIQVVYNGLDNREDYQNVNKYKIRKKLGFEEDEKIILFVGRLSESKGLEVLIKAFLKLSEKNNRVRLVVIGNGDLAHYIGQCQGYWGRITFTGKLPAELVKPFYQISDIGVIPSESEQCSYVALEMMQNNLPIVCSNAPGFNELFIDGENAIIVPLAKVKGVEWKLEVDVDELQSKIQLLLNDRVLSKKIAGNGRVKWELEYMARQMTDKTFKLYKSMFPELTNLSFDN